MSVAAPAADPDTTFSLVDLSVCPQQAQHDASAPHTPASASRTRDLLTSSPRSPVCLLGSTPTMRSGMLPEQHLQARSVSASSSRSASAAPTLPSVTSSPTSSFSSLPCSSDAPTDTEEESDGEGEPAEPPIYFGTPSREEHARRRKVSARMRERRLLRKDSLDLARRRSIGPMDMPISEAEAPVSDAASPAAEVEREEEEEEETGSYGGREESVGCRTIGQLDASAEPNASWPVSQEQDDEPQLTADAAAHEELLEAQAEPTSEAAAFDEQEPAAGAFHESTSSSFAEPSTAELPLVVTDDTPFEANLSYKTESSYRTESESGDEEGEGQAEEEQKQEWQGEEEKGPQGGAESDEEHNASDDAASESGSRHALEAEAAPDASATDLDRTLRLSSLGQQDAAPAAVDLADEQRTASPATEAAELDEDAPLDEDVHDSADICVDASIPTAASASSRLAEPDTPQEHAQVEPPSEMEPTHEIPAADAEPLQSPELSQVEVAQEPELSTRKAEVESEAPAVQSAAEPEASAVLAEAEPVEPRQASASEADEAPHVESPVLCPTDDDEAEQTCSASLIDADPESERSTADVFSSSPMRAAVHVAAPSSSQAPSPPSTPMRISRGAVLTPQSCALAAGSPVSFDYASSPGVALAAHGTRAGDLSLLNNLRAEARHDSAGPESPFVLSRYAMERQDFIEEGLELASKRSGPAEGASPVRRRKSARLSMRYDEEEARRQQSPHKATALVSPNKSSPSKPRPANVADALNAWADAKTMSPVKLQPVSPPAWSLGAASPRKPLRALERSQGHGSPFKAREENASSPSRIPSPTRVLEIARAVPLPPSSPEAPEQPKSSAPVSEADGPTEEAVAAPSQAKAGPSARLAESLRAARLASAQPAPQLAAPAPSAAAKAAPVAGPSAAARPPTGVPAPARRLAASVSGIRAPTAGPAVSSRLPKPAAASGIARPVASVPRKVLPAPKPVASSSLRRAVAPAPVAARAVPSAAATVRRPALAKPQVERKAHLGRPLLASRAASADQPPATPLGAGASAATSELRPAVASAPSSFAAAERPRLPAPSPAPTAPVAAEALAPPPVRTIRSAAVASRGPASAAPRRPTPENQASAVRLQSAAAPKLGALAASSSPERPVVRSAAMRAPVIRDARLASSVPASRVWDSPSKLNRAMSSSTSALPSAKPASSSSSPVRAASREARATQPPPPPPESSVYGPQAAPGRARRVPAGSLAAIKTPPAAPAQPVQAPVPASSLPPLSASTAAATSTSTRGAFGASVPQLSSAAPSGPSVAARGGRQPLSASQVQSAAAIVEADSSVSPMKAARRALQSGEAAPSSGGIDDGEERGAKSLRPRRAVPATQGQTLASQRLFPSAAPMTEAPVAPSMSVPAPVKRSAARVPTASSVLNPTGAGDRAPEIPMSHAELVRLTNQHTRRNEVYLAKLDVVSIRIEGPRPPSPTAKVPKVTGARMDRAEAANARERRARKRGSEESDDDSCSSRAQSADPEQHMRGAGELEAYHTPQREPAAAAARKKSVRWHKALFVGPSEAPADLIAEPDRSPARRAGAARGRSSLAAKTFPLDRNGNIAEADAPLSPRLRKVRVKIIKNIFDDDL